MYTCIRLTLLLIHDLNFSVFPLLEERLRGSYAWGPTGLHPWDTSRGRENQVRLQCVQNIPRNPADHTQTTQTARHIRCWRGSPVKIRPSSNVGRKRGQNSHVQTILNAPQYEEQSVFPEEVEGIGGADGSFQGLQGQWGSGGGLGSNESNAGLQSLGENHL